MANWLMKSPHHKSTEDGHILSDERNIYAMGLSEEEESDTWDQKKIAGKTNECEKEN
jgi:hypothetical protein